MIIVVFARLKRRRVFPSDGAHERIRDTYVANERKPHASVNAVDEQHGTRMGLCVASAEAQSNFNWHVNTRAILGRVDKRVFRVEKRTKKH